MIKEQIDLDLQCEMLYQAQAKETNMSYANTIKNIKSDFLYLQEKYKTNKSNKSELDIIYELHKSRKKSILSYSKSDDGLSVKIYNEFAAEIEYLEKFIPDALDEIEIFKYFDTLDINKSKMNYKLFKTEGEKHFGQNIDSSVIFKYITN